MTSIDPQSGFLLDADRRGRSRSPSLAQARAELDMTASDPFLEHRSLLFAIAYRMLGSVADAEDAVQETFCAGAARADHGEEIRSPKAWLTTTISRVCLDQLGSARAKREHTSDPGYLSLWPA